MDEGTPRHVKCLLAAIAYCGGRQAIADELGISHQAVANWVMHKRLPVAHIRKIVELTDGKFTTDDFIPILED